MKPPLDVLDAKGGPPPLKDEAEGSSQDTPEQLAGSAVREAVEAGDDEALYDALCAIVRMEMNKGEDSSTEKPAL